MATPKKLGSAHEHALRLYLREWRTHKRLSQLDVAGALGATKGEISRLEAGHRKMTLEWLNKLAGALELRPEGLMGPPPNHGAAVERMNNVSPHSVGLEFGIRPSGAESLIMVVNGDEMAET